MDGLNEGIWDEAQRDSCDVISLSHFLPHQASTRIICLLFFVGLVIK